jgi:prepilin-type N-terminal cleavage/methylation domain-containing protein
MVIARRNPVARAFTLIELIAVIVVLAILSGIAIPKYFDYAAQAKASSCKGTLGGVRSAIANYYSKSSLSGAAAYPSLTNLTDYTNSANSVMQEPIAANPYNNLATVQAATWNAGAPPVSGTAGWNYDAAAGKFWANSNVAGENAW